MQASYTMNITLHRAINTTPYEAVSGIMAHRENHQNTDEDIIGQGETTELVSGKNTLDNDQCETFERAAKRQKQYNEEMVKQTSQSRKAPFKIDDMIAIKIDRVNKMSPVPPNMLLDKIMEIRKNSAKIVTPQGITKGFISFSKLIPCTSRNVTVDYCKEISFTAACKQANNTRQ